MADPIGYTPDYSFSGYQGSNPSKPLPATPLDAQLAYIAASIDSVIAALAEVRRSDGALPNGEVTLDSLAESVRLAIQGGQEGILFNQMDPSSIASQGEAEAGAAADKMMTPQRVKQALDAQRSFASQGEAEAGEVANKVMSPLLVKNEIDKLRAFASQSEAEAGAIADKVLSPLTGKQLLDKIQKTLSVSQALTWAEIAAGAAQTQTVTATGAQAGDVVEIGLPGAGIDVGLIPTAWASATHTISVRLYNATASPVTPAALTWKFKVMRF